MGDQKDNIKVSIRIRPLNDRERLEGSKLSVTITDPGRTLSLDIKSDQKTFTFDYIASEEIDQKCIFEKVARPIADSCLTGYNGTIFAYGQTGAGKTFTILGPNIDSSDYKFSSENPNRGLLPRCFEYIFTKIFENISNCEAEFLVKCSYLEIYQEQINDLLDPNPQNLQIREDMKRGVYVEGLIEEIVSNAEETYNLLKIGTLNRHVGSTSMNKESSRSHSVFTLVIESKICQDGVSKYVTSQFHLIDLAGSERQKATDCAGERLKEAGMINKSLSALGNVINSLVDISEGKSRHIHYRDSKLTFLLKDSLGGNSKTSLVANISPAASATFETLSTLKFAQRAKQIKNSAVINEESSGAIALLKLEIKRLKEELKNAKNYVNNEDFQGANDEGGIKENVYSVLDRVLKLKKQDSEMFRNEMMEKDSMIANLNNAVDKMEKKISHSKMIVKFRDATIARLQANGQGKGEDLEELGKEIEILRDEVENNPIIAKMYLENERLRNEINWKITESENSTKVYYLEEVSSKLAEELKNSKQEQEKLLKFYEESALKIKEKDFVIYQYEEKIAKYKEKCKMLISEQCTSMETNENLLLKIQDLSENNSKLVEENKFLIENNLVIESKNKKLHEEHKELKQELETNSNNEKEYKNQVMLELALDKENNEKMTQEIQSLNSMLDEYIKNNAELNSHLNHLQNAFQDLQNEYSALTKEHCSVKYILAEHDTLLKAFKSVSDTLDATESTNKNISIQLETEKSISKTLIQDNKSLQDTLKDLNSIKDDLIKEVNIYKSSSEKYYKNIESLQEDIEELKKNCIENEELKKTNDELQERLEYSIDQQQEIGECLETLRNEFTKILTDRDEKLSIAKNKIKILEEEVNSLNAHKIIADDVESKYKEVQEELKQTKLSLNSFQELNLSLTQKNAELSNSLGKMHSSHVPLYIVDQLRNELKELQEENSSLKEESQKNLEILKTTKSSFSSTKNEILTWRKCIEEKNSTIIDLRNEVRKLKDQESEQSENKILKASLQQKEKDLKDIKERSLEYYNQAEEALENMRRKCLGLQNEANSLRDELRICWQAIAYDKYKNQNPHDNEEVVIKKDDFLMMKNVNNKLNEELKNNTEAIEKLKNDNEEYEKMVCDEGIKRQELEEEIENLTDGLAKITNFVFSLPKVVCTLEEDSIVDSTIKAISYIYKGGHKKVLSDTENCQENFKLPKHPRMKEMGGYKKNK